MSDPVKVDILGLQVNVQRFDEAVNTILVWAREPEHRYICTCTVNEVMSSRDNPALRQVINQADMVTADGMPLVWVQHWWGHATAERGYGPDLMRAVCERGVGLNIRHYLWGGLEGVADRLAIQLKAKYPRLEIVGAFSPPVSPVGTVPDPDVVERLNRVAPDIIWVGLGGPKQNLWMSLYRPVLNAPLLIGVGAAFDFLSGTKKQAPVWMQRNGMEWLFRLVSEPRRLWRRYLVYNPLFVWHILLQTLQRSRW